MQLRAYILSKAALPLDVEFDLQDALHSLRPNLRRYNTYDEALAAVQDIIAREVAQFGAPLGTIGEEEGDEDERRGGGGGGRNGGGAGGAGGGGGAGEEDEDVELAAAEARSLDEMSGRSSGDERDELDEDFEREWTALMSETQSRLGGVSLAPRGEGGGCRTRGRVSVPRVPLSSAVALAVRQREEEEAREREEMKRLVLAANRRVPYRTVPYHTLL
ncbi:hypothetical protein GPECTOR_60g741 [Gonium pectorale]|uniref:Uncharacterized protein n=1 Tax=Gonium pectorale TaxID=33097 RepID=A0A150G599_GONPE|nr:hypothetical protein GPECTOR_60g741 [Gonium pectorale]|eukprot:KXZ44963.1 hypothetical protein GPECTOR_60g741 [Gonium pectorale]